MLTREDVKKEIRRLINDNSGGMKLIELQTEFMRWLYCQKSWGEPAVSKFLKENDIEELVREIPELSLLEYGWDMGTVTRLKYFVYTPVSETMSVESTSP